LTLIGYWSSEGLEGWPEDRRWPDVTDFVDEAWDPEERDLVARYLEHGFLHSAWMGYSPCRLCSKRDNGCLEVTDGTYVWPEGLAHYVEEHSVRLPERFVKHVLRQWDALDQARPDREWWMGQRRRMGRDG
jgi:cytosine/adenosine deaminase-related metal-dependent hydrolase